MVIDKPVKFLGVWHHLLHHKMRNFEIEVFGPVVYVTIFNTTEKAFAIANDTLYGLGSSLSLELPLGVQFYIQPKIFSDDKMKNLFPLLDQQN